MTRAGSGNSTLSVSRLLRSRTPALRPGEEEELAAKFRKYAHSQKIMESLQAAYQVLDSDMIGRACHEVENVSSYDERLSGIASGLSDAESILSDLCRSISGYLDEMEFSGEDFQQTEERLDLIRQMTAKYGSTEEAVLRSLDAKKKRLEELENYEELARAAKAVFEEQKHVLALLCGRLSEERKKAAKVLENRISEELRGSEFPPCGISGRCPPHRPLHGLRLRRSGVSDLHKPWKYPAKTARRSRIRR